MKSAIKAALLLVILMAVPVVPFLWFGESIEQSVQKALREPPSPALVWWVTGLLATDIFLPIPSSAVITYAGGKLGIATAVLASWLGLSTGSVVGFALGRRFGYSLIVRFSDPADLARLGHFTQRHGTAALVLTRALPILAEACVLLLGASRQSWRKFLPPLLVSNALLAIGYAACGQIFRDDSVLLIVIILSGALPLIAALLIRRWFVKQDPIESSRSQSQ